MNDMTSAMLLLGAELGLLLVVVFVVLLARFIKRRSDDKKYVAEFIAEHKENQAERRAAVKKSIQEENFLVDDELEALLDKMSVSEKKLYKNILNMYLGFERKCFPDIRDELLVINNNWIEAMRQGIAHAAEKHMKEAGHLSEEKVKELNDKIDSLTEDNMKIAAELSEAMETMEDIVKEYSLMYAGQENPTMDRLSEDYDKLKKKSDSHSVEKDSEGEAS